MNGEMLTELRKQAETEKDLSKAMILAALAELYCKIEEHQEMHRQQENDCALKQDELQEIKREVKNNSTSLKKLVNNPLVVIGDFIDKMPRAAKWVTGTLLIVGMLALTNKTLMRAILLGFGLESSFVDLIAPP